MDTGHRLIQQTNVEFGLELAKAFVFEAIFTFLALITVRKLIDYSIDYP